MGAVVVASGLIGSGVVAACSSDEDAFVGSRETTPSAIPTAVVEPVEQIETPTATSTPSTTETIIVATERLAATPKSPSETPTASATATSTPTATTFVASPTIAPTATNTVSPTSTATATVRPSPTYTPAPSLTPTRTPTANPTATATHTPAPTPTDTPSPTPDPVELIEFVDSDDCREGISRELLPTIDMVVGIGERSISLVVELADDSRERQQGLMCRETVPHGTGMLFVFEGSFPLNFWMFNTYVPLDIVYMDEARRVVTALRMEPCPRPEGFEDGQWRSHCSSASGGYGSGGAARYALELPAGWLDSLGLDLGNLEGVDFSW